MKNQFDEHGYAICPVCCWPVRPSDALGRSDDYVIHVDCVDRQARAEAGGTRTPRTQRRRRNLGVATDEDERHTDTA